MTNTVTPGGGQGQGPGSVYAATAPPLPLAPPSPAAPVATASPPPGTGGRPDPDLFPPLMWVMRKLSRTPDRLRLLAVVCVLLGLVLGGLGFAALQAKANGLDQARRDLDQLVTVQTAYTALTEADSRATTLFLAGGLEDPAGRRAYLDRLDLAGRALSRASSGAQDLRSRTDLQSAHVALTRYAGLVEAARANNRQGFPIGVAYLKQASALLRSDLLPTLTSVQGRDRVAVSDALARGQGGRLAVLGGLALVLLGLGQVWLFRVSRRIVSPPLLGATALGLVMLIAAGMLLGAAGARSDQAEASGFRLVLLVSQARVAAFDAKSNESLTLIARGNGGQYEKAYQALSDQALDAASSARDADPLGPDLFGVLQDLGEAHRQIRAADDGGDWDRAVSLATGPAVDGAGDANSAFDTFDQLSRTWLEAARVSLDQELSRPVGPLRVSAPLLLLAGLLVAGAAWAGVAPRLREFR